MLFKNTKKDTYKIITVTLYYHLYDYNNLFVTLLTNL